MWISQKKSLNWGLPEMAKIGIYTGRVLRFGIVSRIIDSILGALCLGKVDASAFSQL